MDGYRRKALIAAFGNLPDNELMRLGFGLEAHHTNCMESGQVVLVPTEIHTLIHTLTRLGGNAYASGETDDAQTLLQCARTLLTQFTVKPHN